MFCALTRPDLEMSTDLGRSPPVTVWTRVSRPASAGVVGPGVARALAAVPWLALGLDGWPVFARAVELAVAGAAAVAALPLGALHPVRTASDSTATVPTAVRPGRDGVGTPQEYQQNQESRLNGPAVSRRVLVDARQR